MIVASPVSPAARERNVSFKDLVGTALIQHSQLRQTPDYALQSGVCVYTLIGYAAGCCAPEDRPLVEHWLAKMPWAMQVVVALVKGARSKDSLAARLLERAREDSLPAEDVLLECIELCYNQAKD
jgi:hypothetical protein